MNVFKLIPNWAVSPAVLLIIAAFFKFLMRGYDYMAYSFAFLAALLFIRHFAGDALWRGIMILVCLGLMYFCAVEIPIVKNSFTDKDCERDYLIVLGAAVHGDTPSLALQHRLEGALDYMEKHPESVAIVSGGKGQGENISEALCMYNWLTEHGISAERIIMEDKATSTMENLQFSFEIIRSRGDEPDGNIAIVSSAYHLYRAKCMASILGAKAAGVRGNMGYPIYMLNCYIREAFGVTHLWVFGR